MFNFAKATSLALTVAVLSTPAFSSTTPVSTDEVALAVPSTTIPSEDRPAAATPDASSFDEAEDVGRGFRGSFRPSFGGFRARTSSHAFRARPAFNRQPRLAHPGFRTPPAFNGHQRPAFNNFQQRAALSQPRANMPLSNFRPHIPTNSLHARNAFNNRAQHLSAVRHGSDPQGFNRLQAFQSMANRVNQQINQLRNDIRNAPTLARQAALTQQLRGAEHTLSRTLEGLSREQNLTRNNNGPQNNGIGINGPQNNNGPQINGPQINGPQGFGPVLQPNMGPSYGPAVASLPSYAPAVSYMPTVPQYVAPTAYAPPATLPAYAPTPVQQQPAQAPSNCLTKEYTQDGQLVMRDLCTNEVLVGPSVNRQSSLDPQYQSRPVQQ